MATDDQQILVTGQASAPANWIVPGNGQVTPRAIYAVFNGTNAATTFYPALKVISDGGETVGVYPCPTAVAAGVSAQVSWFPRVAVGATAATPPSGITTETLYLDSKSTQSVSSSQALVAGAQYVAVVEGTFSAWNEVLNVGTPEADAMFPSSTVGRVSTEVGVDADTIFAWPSDHPHTAGNDRNIRIALDGVTFQYITPENGPFFVPQVGHLYRYNLIGQGHTVSFKIQDSAYGDNYGKLKITVQVPSGTGTGSGAGSLVPPTDTTLNGDTLQVVGGIPAWAAGGGSGITDLTSTSSSITVTSPTGPTANVEVATVDGGSA